MSPHHDNTAPLPSQPSDHAARAERRPLFRDGALMLNCSVRRVAVKNLSATGARVEGRVWAELPHQVVLVEPTLDLRCRARVVWQRHGVAGLEILERW